MFNYVDGSIYKGGWKDDKENGKGILVDKNGTEIEGEWLDGNRLNGLLFFWLKKKEDGPNLKFASKIPAEPKINN